MKLARYALSLSFFCLWLLVLVPLVVAPTPAESAPPSGLLWLDEFSDLTLDPAWAWVREDPTYWSLAAAPGHLRITTQTGGIAGPGSTQRNILLATAPAGDYQITTRVTIKPTKNYQHAAILVYQDGENYVELNRAYVDGQTVDFDGEVGGAITSLQRSETATTLYMRIVKRGVTYSGYYSPDGQAWELAGQHVAHLDAPRIGLSAANGISGVPEISADFDFFKVEAAGARLFLPAVRN